MAKRRNAKKRKSRRRVRLSRSATRRATSYTIRFAPRSSRQHRAQKFTLERLFAGYTGKEFAKKAREQRSLFIGELQNAYRYRGLVLYLGAGVSQSLGLPSWAELVRSLTVRMMSEKVRSAVDALQTLNDEDRWSAVASVQPDVERGADYGKPILMMARTIKDHLGDRLPLIIAQHLYRRLGYFIRIKNGKLVRVSRKWRWVRRTGQKLSRFSPEGESSTELPTSPLLDAIVALARAERGSSGVQHIVNYNYDDLVDEKLREKDVRCVTVRSGKDQLAPGVLPCHHVHGVLPLQGALYNLRPTGRKIIGNFVFSEDEYHEEYADPYKWSNMTQMSLLGRHTGLFIGLSMEDPNIRRLIDVTHRQYPDVKHYAILSRRRPLGGAHDSKHSVLRNLYEEVETNSFERIGVRVIWVDRHEEIPAVLREICALEEKLPSSSKPGSESRSK
jgi:hypothetical protein